MEAMSKFDADFYVRFRPFYPPELYEPLAVELARLGLTSSFRIADVGCGTGHSAASLLKSGLSAVVSGVDPDPGMLAKARELCPGVSFTVGGGERTGLEAGAFDAVTVGSAFHWMDAPRASEEFFRLLRPGGLVFIYEYQFPKAQKLTELNEWIRREFNLRWKAPMQRPRGDFTAVTACFRTSPKFRGLTDNKTPHKTPMWLELGAGELTGLLLSQSRVLHYEAGMDAPAKAAFREGLAARIQEQLPGRELFDFNLQSGLWSKL